MRLFAAFAVLVGHAWPLTGRHDVPRVAGVQLFDLGVYVFFCLSGFLIATSWARSPRVVPFLLRRVFRIFPALVVVVFATVFVVGPLVSSLSATVYFGEPRTWLYLTNVTLTTTYTLPGVFLANPIDGTVNGSLWTLGPEFLCYLGVVAIGLITLRAARPEWFRLAVFAAVGIGVAVIYLSGSSPRGAEDVLGVLVFFAGGALLAQLDGLRMSAVLRRPVVVVGVTAAWIVVGTVVPEYAMLFAWLLLPVIVVGVGAQSTPGVRRVGRFGDFSYGLYLWGFPVQQVVTERLPGIPLAVDILMVATIAGALAFASWWLVERRAIALGRHLGDRFRMMRKEMAHN